MDNFVVLFYFLRITPLPSYLSTVGKVCIRGGGAEENHIRNPASGVAREHFCSQWYEFFVWEGQRETVEELE